MDLVEHWPPSIVKDKVYTFNEDYLSHFCSFMRLMLSMPPYLVLSLTLIWSISLVVVRVARLMVLS